MNTLFPTTLNLTLMQQRRAGGTTQSTGQPSVSYLKNYDNVVGVLCCYKAVSVLEQSHARQFARYSSDFHKKRLWVGELKMLEQLSLSLSLMSRNLSRPFALPGWCKYRNLRRTCKVLSRLVASSERYWHLSVSALLPALLWVTVRRVRAVLLQMYWLSTLYLHKINLTSLMLCV